MTGRSGDLSGFRWSREFFELTTSSLFVAYLAFLILVVGVAAAWAWLGQMDVVVEAGAVIRPVGDVSVVKNASSGRVLRKSFANGDVVTKDAVLWEIESTALAADKANAESRLARDRERMRELEVFSRALAEGRNSVPLSDENAYAMALAYYSDVGRLGLALAQASEAHARELALPSTMSLPQRRKDLEDAEKKAGMELDAYKAQARLKLDADLDATRNEMDELEKSSTELGAASAACVVRSPIAGRIEELRRLDAGDNLFAGEEVLRVVPARSGGLDLQLRVDPRDIAELRSGMAIVLKFPGLPPSQYGTIGGRVTRVPADATTSSAGTAFFEVEATLDRAFVENRRGERVDLIPGMVADARIVVKRERILRLILEKLDFLT